MRHAAAAGKIKYVHFVQNPLRELRLLLYVPVTVHREQNVKREDQQDATIRCLLLTSISTCFGHHYAHLQESKEPDTAYGVLFWFCWMWLVAVVESCVVGCEQLMPIFRRSKALLLHMVYCSGSAGCGW